MDSTVEIHNDDDWIAFFGKSLVRIFTLSTIFVTLIFLTKTGAEIMFTN